MLQNIKIVSTCLEYKDHVKYTEYEVLEPAADKVKIAVRALAQHR